jgi:hypothetical protein
MTCGCHELANPVPLKGAVRRAIENRTKVTEPGAVATGCEHSSREDRFEVEVELSIPSLPLRVL